MPEQTITLRDKDRLTVRVGGIELQIDSSLVGHGPHVQIDIRYPEDHRLETFDISGAEFRAIVRVPSDRPRLIVSR